MWFNTRVVDSPFGGWFGTDQRLLQFDDLSIFLLQLTAIFHVILHQLRECSEFFTWKYTNRCVLNEHCAIHGLPQVAARSAGPSKRHFTYRHTNQRSPHCSGSWCGSPPGRGALITWMRPGSTMTIAPKTTHRSHGPTARFPRPPRWSTDGTICKIPFEEKNKETVRTGKS